MVFSMLRILIRYQRILKYEKFIKISSKNLIKLKDFFAGRRLGKVTKH